MTSPELTGGAGLTYEDAVAAQYLAAMVSGTKAAAVDARAVQRVAQQYAAFGKLDSTRCNRHLLGSKLNWRVSHESSQMQAHLQSPFVLLAMRLYRQNSRLHASVPLVAC